MWKMGIAKQYFQLQEKNVEEMGRFPDKIKNTQIKLKHKKND